MWWIEPQENFTGINLAAIFDHHSVGLPIILGVHGEADLRGRRQTFCFRSPLLP